MPTGAPNAGETIEEAARRELAEEAGVQAGRLEHVATIHTSKSVVDEQADLFIARDLVRLERSSPDITEELEIGVFRFDEVMAMVARSEIVDAMTVVAVLHADRRRA